MIHLITNLKYLRDKCQMSQEQVASSIEVPVKRYQQWEYGSEPPLIHVKQLAELYNVTVDVLVYSDLSKKKIPADNPSMVFYRKFITSPNHIKGAVKMLLNV